jgi:hypothetical protein
MRSILLFSCCCLTHLPPPGGGLFGSSQKPSRLSSPPCLSINHFEPTVLLFAHSALHRRRSCDGPRRYHSSLSFSHWSLFPPHATPQRCPPLPSPPPDQQYVCTGLDLYLFQEPDMMSAMALVHSRIRRVIYLHPDPLCGALGSTHSVHEMRSLNHRFRVYRVNNITAP